MKQNIFTLSSQVVKQALGKGMPLLCGGLFLLLATALLLLAVALFSGYSPAQITTDEPVTPKPAEFTYWVSISAPPIQISGGNLHWHKNLPDDSYTLEDMAIEIYNFGDSDILVAQLEIRVDDNTRLFNIDMVIPGGETKNLVIQPMMEGYDGGAHRVYVALLDEKSRVLYQNKGEDVGPLEPIPGTGSWKPEQN